MFKNNLSYSNSFLVSLKLEKFHENGFAPKSIVFIRMFYDLTSKHIMSMQKLTRPHEIYLARKKLESYIMFHLKASKGRYKTFKMCEKLVMLNNIFHRNVFRILYLELFQYAEITYLFNACNKWSS